MKTVFVGCIYWFCGNTADECIVIGLQTHFADAEMSLFGFRDFPDYPFYSTPIYFQSDWLNEFWDSRTDCADDYRFVYIGPKGSWYNIKYFLENTNVGLQVTMIIVTHAGIAAGVGRAFSRVCVCVCVCLFVRTLTG